ncbi:MAG: LysM peptidoglycan-binding domain-containing protein [Anaerolineaceae bacterium]
MKRNLHFILSLLVILILVSGCTPEYPFILEVPGEQSTPTLDFVITPFPTRRPYRPGELVDYIAQTGDTLPALAIHFNTSVEEIMTANPIIPNDATTMPPGMPMKIPIYYRPLWGSSYQIIPDSLFINGPEQIDFDSIAYVNKTGGWLKNYSAYVAGITRSGAEIVDYVALNYSISPRLLLAILDYQTGALSDPRQPVDEYLLGFEDKYNSTIYLQLLKAANLINNGYYDWRSGRLTELELEDGSLERPDPWQNAATVGLQYYYTKVFTKPYYQRAISPDGLAATYAKLFGDPWLDVVPHIPGSLRQPDFRLPFLPGKLWAYTGGPHTGWGEGAPLAAIDFAPPSVLHGCALSSEWVVALADGIIARSETGIVVLDLDMDGDERTGWIIFYLHIGEDDRIPLGTRVKAGDPIGHPSCERGTSTGTHVHVARKYNGEWLLAEGALGFNLEGWLVTNGDTAYEGTLAKSGVVVRACVCADARSQLSSSRP